MDLEEFKNLILTCCTSDNTDIQSQQEEIYNQLVRNDINSVIQLHIQNIQELPSTVVQKTSAVLLKRLIFICKNENLEIFTENFVNQIANVLFIVIRNHNYNEIIRIIACDIILLVCQASKINGFQIDFITPLWELTSNNSPSVEATVISCLAQFINNGIFSPANFNDEINILISSKLNSENMDPNIILSVFRIIYASCSYIDTSQYISAIAEAISIFQEPHLNILLRDLSAYKVMIKNIFREGAELLLPPLVALVQNPNAQLSSRGLSMKLITRVIKSSPDYFFAQSDEIFDLFLQCISQIDETFDPTISPFVDFSLHSFGIVSLRQLSKIYHGYYQFFGHVIQKFIDLIEANTFQSICTAFLFMGCIADYVTAFHGCYFPNENMDIFMAAFTSENDVIRFVALECFKEILDAFSRMWSKAYKLNTEGLLDALIDISSAQTSVVLTKISLEVITQLITLFPNFLPSSCERLCEYLFSMVDTDHIDVLCSIFDALSIVAATIKQDYFPYADKTLEITSEIIKDQFQNFDQIIFFSAINLYASLLYVLPEDRGLEFADSFITLILSMDLRNLTLTSLNTIRDAFIVATKTYPGIFIKHFDVIYQYSLSTLLDIYLPDHFDFNTNRADLFEYEIRISVEENELICYKKNDITRVIIAFDFLNILSETCAELFNAHNAEILSAIEKLHSKGISQNINKYVIIFVHKLIPTFDKNNIQRAILAMHQSALAFSTISNSELVSCSTVYFVSTIRYFTKNYNVPDQFLYFLVVCLFKQCIESVQRQINYYHKTDFAVQKEYNLTFETSIQFQLMKAFRSLISQNPPFVITAVTSQCELLQGNPRSNIIADFFPMTIYDIGKDKRIITSTFEFWGSIVAHSDDDGLFESFIQFLRAALEMRSYRISQDMISILEHILRKITNPQKIAVLLEVFSTALSFLNESILWATIIVPACKVILGFGNMIDLNLFANSINVQIGHFDNADRLSERQRTIVLNALGFLIESANVDEVGKKPLREFSQLLSIQ